MSKVVTTAIKYRRILRISCEDGSIREITAAATILFESRVHFPTLLPALYANIISLRYWLGWQFSPVLYVSSQSAAAIQFLNKFTVNLTVFC
jgi:hypothetical protein